MILSSLVAMTVGMVITACASDLIVLSLGRLLTGIGVGTMVPSISALAAEYSSRRLRNLAVIVVAIGFPVGGLLCEAARPSSFTISIGARYSLRAPLSREWRSWHPCGSLRSPSNSLRRCEGLRPWRNHAVRARAQSAADGITASLARAALQSKRLRYLSALSASGDADLDVGYGLHSATVYYSLNWVPKAGRRSVVLGIAGRELFLPGPARGGIVGAFGRCGARGASGREMVDHPPPVSGPPGF